MRKFGKGSLLRSTVLAGFAATAFAATPALAQEAEEDEEEEAEQQTAGEDRILVTGSLLRRNEFTSSSPIQVITSEVATLEGLIDASEILQGASVAAGSTQINSQFGAFVIEGGPGVNTVSLRGLGAQRTLIIFNGRRLGPAGVGGQVGAVDTNVLPSSIIQRYEILKDGASSIYGSDAVAGVINVITRTSIDEPELSVTYNAPGAGGAESFLIDGAYGLNFDRGNITFSGSYQRIERMKINERDYLNCSADYVFDAMGNRVDLPALTPTRPDAIGEPICYNGNSNIVSGFGVNYRVLRFASHFFIDDPAAASAPGGLFDGFRLTGNDNSALGRLTLADLTGYQELDWSDPRWSDIDLIPQTERISLYTTGSFDLGFGEAYGEFLYNNRQTESEGYRQFFPTVDATHPFIQQTGVPYVFDPFLGQFAAAVAPGIRLADFSPTVAVPNEGSVDVDYFHGVAGLRGDFGPELGPLANWSYDVNFSHSRSDGEYTSLVIDNRNVEDIFRPGGDIVHTFDGSGDIVCTRISDGSSCPVVNYFSPEFIRGNLTQEQTDFLFETETGETVFTQSVFNAVTTGEVFDLPAGPVGAAFGVQYREVEIDDQPGAISIANQSWGRASAQRTQGEDEVFEAFGEIEVPVIAGRRFFEELTVNGSLRWFDYADFEADSVYKLGLNWQVNPVVRVRSTYGTSYRAPGLFERFLNDQTGFQAQDDIDPCIDWGLSNNQILRDNCAADGIPDDYQGPFASATVTTGGGDELVPETSNAFTVGTIITPTGLDLSIALDYFEIEVNEQVSALGAANILAACYGRPGFPNAFCDLFTRAPVGSGQDFRVLNVVNDYINISQQVTEGLDMTVRYEHEFGFGTMVVDMQGTWTFTDLVDPFQEFSGFRSNDFNGTVGDPDFVANSAIRFDRGDWTLSWFTDFTSRVSSEPFLNTANPRSYLGRPDTFYKRNAEAQFYHGASVRYQGSDWQVIGGVSNIFDEAPPAMSSASGASRVGVSPIFGTQYDLRGRSFYVSASKAF